MSNMNILKESRNKLVYNNDDSNESEKSIIDEIIDSLGKEVNIDEKFQEDFLTTNEKSNIKAEYEIVMNCDDSEYIIYYKKSK